MVDHSPISLVSAIAMEQARYLQSLSGIQAGGDIMQILRITALLLLAACASGGQEDKDVISNQVGDWDATLSPTAGSSVRGDARAQSVGVGTGVRVSISGAQNGAQHPWHVHRGVCGDNGAIVGSAGAYPTLSVGADGTATANATIDVALRENETYYVNVHRSPTDLGTIVSCGRLSND